MGSELMVDGLVLSMTSVTVLCPNARRCSVKVTPGMLLKQILEEACLKQGFEVEAYQLENQRRRVDLALPFRLADDVAKKQELLSKYTQKKAENEDRAQLEANRLARFEEDLKLEREKNEKASSSAPVIAPTSSENQSFDAPVFSRQPENVSTDRLASLNRLLQQCTQEEANKLSADWLSHNSTFVPFTGVIMENDRNGKRPASNHPPSSEFVPPPQKAGPAPKWLKRK
ncbi:hypothetical protein ANCCEY_14215 [Ancylostoma ceylanicum]|uniref:TUG ubiquitin-like domain-containing protein n=1 Tax=Ancylostoma ceylanicum TaxID=53326 RepID=A0A0D6LGA2_9BILA|nr:hypothetical protein ANCCEY_14215 [Ancylostoma ceylanicum]